MGFSPVPDAHLGKPTWAALASAGLCPLCLHSPGLPCGSSVSPGAFVPLLKPCPQTCQVACSVMQ